MALADTALAPVVRLAAPGGLVVTRYEALADGVPVHGVHHSELRDASGNLLSTAGGAARLVDRVARGEAALHGHHLKAATPAGDARSPVRMEPVWFAVGDALHAAYREWRFAFDGATPVAELVIVDAVSGDELARANLIHEYAPQGFHTYTHPDGRPLLSPYGQTWPHPTGVPDGWVPTTAAAQTTVRQADAYSALADPWLADGATITSGNHAIAFFNSVVEPNGEVADLFGPRHGPEFRAEDGDFHAHANAGADFIYPYDPSATSTEHFQWPTGFPDMPAGIPGHPDPADAALNAKIVQAFYSVNWMHDFLYRAGFDEAAGNAQLSNFGRGGIEGDPLTIHSGFLTTFVATTPDGIAPYMALGINDRSRSWRDASMDFGVLAHEYGHYVIARLSGMLGARERQPSALHEGIADFFGLLVGVSAGDDFSAAYPVGQYYNLDYVHRADLPVVGVTPDAMYYGTRRYPYSTDLARNPLVFHNLAVAPTLPFYDWKGRGPQLNEPHTAGEVFAVALFQCFGGLVAANPAADFEELRLRMAGYLLAGLAMFPEQPTFIEARNAVLGVVRAADGGDYAACRRGFAARGMGADAIGPERTSVSLQPTFSGFADSDQKVMITGFWTVDEAAGTTINVRVRNTGFVDANDVTVSVSPSVAGSVRFRESGTVVIPRLAPDEQLVLEMPVVIRKRSLPKAGDEQPNRVFAYGISAQVAGAPASAGSSFNASERLVGPVDNGGGGNGGWWLLLAAAAALWSRLRRRRALAAAQTA